MNAPSGWCTTRRATARPEQLRPLKREVKELRQANEIRRRTRVVGAFLDGESAPKLAAARLRHIAGREWSTKRYLSMEFRQGQQAMPTTA